MHLAYVDDSGSDKPSPIVVVGAVVIDDEQFWEIDVGCGAIAENVLPPDKIDQFEEFHAAHLFGGYEVFRDVPENERHVAIYGLLSAMKTYQLPFIYAAVDKRALEASVLGSSLPMDVAFRICACGVADWNSALLSDPNDPRKIVTTAQRAFLLIADDTDDKSLKQALRRTFRALRPRTVEMEALKRSRMWMCHDEMYFGDSKSSIGIQLADLCAHIMLRRLRDGIKDDFFDALAPLAVCAKPEPYWTQCREVMRSHDDSASYALRVLPSTVVRAASGPPERAEGHQ